MKNVFKIRELRLENGLTQKELAIKINSTDKSIWAYEKGNASPPIDTLIALANFFGCTVDYLIGRSDDFGNVNVSGRSSEDLSENERKLLEQFRLMPEARQRTVLDMMDCFVETSVAVGGKKRA